ncbi:MAG: TetR/AcrR family transcriptional regulator [Deltaproteobacteria bacterium]|nr:TetR/AcrR family transcriptional regulator [Deltaproteobacteria bacterium]
MSNDSLAGRAAQKADTRRRILEKAKVLCARHGFARTRTVDVARAARVSHGSVFVHFPSRDDLFDAVLFEMAREITDALHALATEGASLREVLAAHLECLADREDQIRWLLVDAPVLPESFRLAWVSLQSAISFHVSAAAEREMASGKVRRMPLHLLFNTWIGLVNHYVVNRELFAPGKSVLRTHGRMLLDHFLGLVETNDRKGEGR